MWAHPRVADRTTVVEVRRGLRGLEVAVKLSDEPAAAPPSVPRGRSLSGCAVARLPDGGWLLSGPAQPVGDVHTPFARLRRGLQSGDTIYDEWQGYVELIDCGPPAIVRVPGFRSYEADWTCLAPLDMRYYVQISGAEALPLPDDVAPRQFHSLTAVGQGAVAFGGQGLARRRDGLCGFAPSGGEGDLLNDAFFATPSGVEALRPRGDPPSPRAEHAAMFAPALGAVLVIGGRRAAGGRQSAVDVFALSPPGEEDEDWAWRPVRPAGAAPAARYGHAAVARGDAEVLVFGGLDPATDSVLPAGLHVLSLGAGGDARWSTLALTMLGLRYDCAAVVQQDHLLVFGEDCVTVVDLEAGLAATVAERVPAAQGGGAFAALPRVDGTLELLPRVADRQTPNALRVVDLRVLEPDPQAPLPLPPVPPPRSATVARAWAGRRCARAPAVERFLETDWPFEESDPARWAAAEVRAAREAAAAQGAPGLVRMLDLWLEDGVRTRDRLRVPAGESAAAALAARCPVTGLARADAAADVALVSDESHKALRVDSRVLHERCPYYAAMAGFADGRSARLRFPGSFAALRGFVAFLYTEELRVMPGALFELLLAPPAQDMPRLHALCVRQVAARIDARNSAELLLALPEPSAPELYSNVFACAVANLPRVKRTPAFAELAEAQRRALYFARQAYEAGLGGGARVAQDARCGKIEEGAAPPLPPLTRQLSHEARALFVRALSCGGVSGSAGSEASDESSDGAERGNPFEGLASSSSSDDDDDEDDDDDDR